LESHSLRAKAFSGSIVIVLALSALLVPAGTSEARESVPDEYGYKWTDSISDGETVSYDWKDITSTGTDTLLKGDDVSGGPYPIGFGFEFYGSSYTEFYVSTNGLVTFGSGSTESENDIIPSLKAPNDLIAAYWDDLQVEYSAYWTGYILYETLGLAPNRQLVVEFFQVERVGVYGPMNFEVILNETGEIWLQYEALSSLAGESATVGIENGLGTIGTMYCWDWGALSDGLAVMFSLSPIVLGPDQVDSGPLGGTVLFPMDVVNNQDFSDSVDIVFSSDEGWPIELLDGAFSPLSDTNANGVPDTGPIPPWSSVQIVVEVTIPLAPTGPYMAANLTAFSYADPANLDPACLTVTATLADFTGPYSDHGVDTNANSLYDYLEVEFSLDVYVEGFYYIYAGLYDVSGSWICNTMVETPPFAVGVHPYSIMFDGLEISSALADGPYQVDLTIYDPEYEHLGIDQYTTGAYDASEFEHLAILSPPYSDHGLDSDLDGECESLVISAQVDVVVPEYYLVGVALYSAGWDYITEDFNMTYLTAGVHSVEVPLSGWRIFDSGMDGPFSASITLRHVSESLGSAVHTTGAYTFDQFEPYPAMFNSPHSDHVVDDDGDSLYDRLVVDVSVSVVMEGSFCVIGELHGDEWNVTATSYVNAWLPTGDGVIELEFDGWELRAIGYDGPRDMTMTLKYGNIWDEQYLDWDWHTLGDYSLESFEDEIPTLISSWDDSPPAADGVFSPGEWDLATPISMTEADPFNSVDALMMAVNNGTHLLFCYDVVGETDENIYQDSAAISFDTGDDDTLTGGGEDQFLVGGDYTPLGGEAHFVYDELLDSWPADCYPFDPSLPDHEGLCAAMGFGPSENLTTPHRIYEFCIPLALLDASPGDSLGLVSYSVGGPGVQAPDMEGWFSSWPNYGPIMPDVKLYGSLVLSSGSFPVTTMMAEGVMGDSGWYLSDVEVSLDAEDLDEGVDATYWRVDGGSWQSYSAPFMIFGDGERTLEYYSVNLVGNEEAVHSAVIRIDTSAPTTSADVSGAEGSDGWYTSDVTVSLSASDGASGSGIADTIFRLDSGTWMVYDGGDISVSGDGEHVFEFNSTDVASNQESTGSVTVRIDASAPYTTATVAGGTVALAALDNASGVDVTMYRVDDGTWAEYTDEVEVTGEGDHIVQFYTVDVAGNEEDTRNVTLTVEADTDDDGATLFGFDWTFWFVLMIIVLLIMIAVPKLLGKLKAAKESDARAAIKDIGTAVSQFADDTGGPPRDAAKDKPLDKPGDAPAEPKDPKKD